MKHLIVFLTLFVNANRLYSQSPIYPKNQTFRFFFSEGVVADTNNLNLKIRYTNTELDTILIPFSLIEGTKYEPYANIYTELQKLENGKYKRFVDKHVDYFYGDSITDPIIEYAKLSPGDTAELHFNLISRIGAFYKGKYRMRVHLLKIPINDPPYAPKEYAVSRWFYFQVIKDLDYHELY
ncbi:hypothetical protein [Longitalea arenae]|uniref:hypothetical protein n=1 Tax=Longitalea arenae TaxID=2812558 RepID=UPI00196720BC|nr:hypothetical protein [Longitalea arenae]